MSKLSDHQILAQVAGMQATVARLVAEGKVSQAQRVSDRIAAYRSELDGRRKTAQVERFSSGQVVDSRQNSSEKLLNIEQSREAMSEPKKTVLDVAGEDIAKGGEALLEIGKWVGRGQAFGMMGARANAAQAQVLKQLKDAGDYKVLGLTWEQFCERQVGVSRATVDRIIGNFEEFGASYFALSNVMRISATTYRLIAGAVDETTVEIDGEKIPITKTNAARISEAVAQLAKEVQQRDETIGAKKAEVEKLKSERSAASKAAEKARAEFAEYKRAQSALFADADDDHRTLLEAQSHFDLAMGKLSAVYKRDLSEANQARYIGLTDYIYRALVQASFDARDKYGCPLNMAAPVEIEEAERTAPNPRNLIAEISSGGRRNG